MVHPDIEVFLMDPRHATGKAGYVPYVVLRKLAAVPVGCNSDNNVAINRREPGLALATEANALAAQSRSSSGVHDRQRPELTQIKTRAADLDYAARGPIARRGG
jgi:hypothetical protein